MIEQVRILNDGRVQDEIRDLAVVSVMTKTWHCMGEYALNHNCIEFGKTICELKQFADIEFEQAAKKALFEDEKCLKFQKNAKADLQQLYYQYMQNGVRCLNLVYFNEVIKVIVLV